jgi:hypothetical protein
MKKARIILALITLFVFVGGVISIKAHNRWGLSNLWYVTTGNFTQNSAGRVLSYAAMSQYRTFWTDPSEAPVLVTYELYTLTRQSTTTIGGDFYFITVVSGSPFPTVLGIFSDNGQ